MSSWPCLFICIIFVVVIIGREKSAGRSESAVVRSGVVKKGVAKKVGASKEGLT